MDSMLVILGVRKCLTERPVEDDGLCRRINTSHSNVLGVQGGIPNHSHGFPPSHLETVVIRAEEQIR